MGDILIPGAHIFKCIQCSLPVDAGDHTLSRLKNDWHFECQNCEELNPWDIVLKILQRKDGMRRRLINSKEWRGWLEVYIDYQRGENGEPMKVSDPEEHCLPYSSS
jgi:hypothetical protein